MTAMGFLLGDIVAAKGWAPLRWPAVRHCHLKYAHDSKSAADRQLRSMQARPDFDGAAMESYECPICGRYHIGRNRKA